MKGERGCSFYFEAFAAVILTPFVLTGVVYSAIMEVGYGVTAKEYHRNIEYIGNSRLKVPLPDGRSMSLNERIKTFGRKNRNISHTLTMEVWQPPFLRTLRVIAFVAFAWSGIGLAVCGRDTFYPFVFVPMAIFFALKGMTGLEHLPWFDPAF